MIHFYFGIGFSVLALIVAVFAIRAQTKREPFGASEGIKPYRIGFWVIVLVVALIAPTTPALLLKGVIGLVLIVLLVGEVLMAIPGTPVQVRLGTNSAIYFVVWLILARMAFGVIWQQTGWTQTLMTVGVGLVPLVVAGLYFMRVRAPLGDVRLTVIIYMLNATLVAVMATLLYLAAPSAGSGLLLLGVICLVTPDALLGWSTWRKEIVRLPLLQMVLLFVAGLLLAWATWGMLWSGVALFS